MRKLSLLIATLFLSTSLFAATPAQHPRADNEGAVGTAVQAYATGNIYRLTVSTIIPKVDPMVISGNVYTTGYSSAAYLYGDGSNITGLPDGVTNHLLLSNTGFYLHTEIDSQINDLTSSTTTNKSLIDINTADIVNLDISTGTNKALIDALSISTDSNKSLIDTNTSDIFNLDASTTALESTKLTNPVDQTLNANDYDITNISSMTANRDAVNTGHVISRIYWNEIDGTYDIDLGGGVVTLQVGQEGIVPVKNTTGSLIEDGKAVYLSGVLGDNALASLSTRDDINTSPIAGITTEPIQNGATGFINIYGYVRGLDTTGSTYAESWSAGDKLYLGLNGGLSNLHPTIASHTVTILAKVVRVHANDGFILVTTPLSFTIGNEIDGPIRQSVINKSTGTSAFSTFSVVNDEGHRASFAIASSNNTIFGSESVGFYNEGYGPMKYVNDGNVDHIWYADPTDSHDFSALSNILMRLYSNGKLSLFNGSFDTAYGISASTLTVSGTFSLAGSSFTWDGSTISITAPFEVDSATVTTLTADTVTLVGHSRLGTKDNIVMGNPSDKLLTWAFTGGGSTLALDASAGAQNIAKWTLPFSIACTADNVTFRWGVGEDLSIGWRTPGTDHAYVSIVNGFMQMAYPAHTVNGFGSYDEFTLNIMGAAGSYIGLSCDQDDDNTAKIVVGVVPSITIGTNTIVTGSLTSNGTFYSKASYAFGHAKDVVVNTTASTDTFHTVNATWEADVAANGFTISGASATYTGLGGTPKIFELNGFFSAESDTVNTIAYWTVFKNGSILDGFIINRKMATTGDVGAMSIGGLISLATGDILDIRIAADKSAAITNKFISFEIHQVN